MADDILLQGYYGFANLGDDVLMQVAHRLVAQRFPTANIAVYSNSADPHYVAQLLGYEPEIVTYGSPRRFDLIVHGGGGTFFDSDRSLGLKDLTLNAALVGLGPRRYTALYKRRRWTGVAARKRIGIGIGIGRYAWPSRKLPHAVPVLRAFDHLMVRDSRSAANLARIDGAVSATVGGDLSMLTDAWMGSRPSVVTRPSIAIVLRDWPAGTTRLLPFFRALQFHLERAGASTRLFSLSAVDDAASLSQLDPDEVTVWDPRCRAISEFLASLSEHALVVSSRAHGVAIAACLGIPSVAVVVEEKLRVFAESMPGAIEGPALKDTQRWPDFVLERLQAVGDSRPSIVDELALIRERVECACDAALTAAEGWT